MGPFASIEAVSDSHASGQPDIPPNIRNKTCINKLRNCAACYVCSCSLFCKWPWDCDTAHAVFPMNVSWHAKDWSGLTAQMLIRLINPDTFKDGLYQSSTQAINISGEKSCAASWSGDTRYFIGCFTDTRLLCMLDMTLWNPKKYFGCNQ